MTIRIFISIILAVTITSIVNAEEVILTPDKIVRVNFELTPPFSYTPDTLCMGIGPVGIQSAYTTRRGAIYDGGQLLGTYESNLFGNYVGDVYLGICSSWKSIDSVFDVDNTEVIEFTGIQGGSIDGRIDFSIETGMMTCNLDHVTLSMGEAYASNGTHASLPEPVITQVSLIPEPASLMLVSIGGVIIRYRIKNNKRIG